MELFPQIMENVNRASKLPIDPDRKVLLDSLTSYIAKKINQNEAVALNFICTHNSRRSQFAQVWSHALSHYFELPISSHSGGTEVTAFAEAAVESLERMGFPVEQSGGMNPHYVLWSGPADKRLTCYSKLYDDPSLAEQQFAAIMTCSSAEENCPFIPNAEKRFSLNYEDPKAFDGTFEQDERYDERSLQICSELYYALSNVKQQLTGS